ncbi:MAG: hypothetical protein ACRDHN_14680 [Thermomicrobiales bacterium]
MFVALAACGDSKPDATAVPAAIPAAEAVAADAVVADYYPLAIGNRWSYACSVEGQPQVRKQLEITRGTKILDHPGFVATYTVNGEPSEVFLWADPDSMVHRALTADGQLDEVVGARKAAIGDPIGELRIARVAKQSTTATGEIDVLVAENFAFDEPSSSPQHRADWVGQFFAEGIGLVAEADGLGGECELVAYSVSGRKGP